MILKILLQDNSLFRQLISITKIVFLFNFSETKLKSFKKGCKKRINFNKGIYNNKLCICIFSIHLTMEIFRTNKTCENKITVLTVIDVITLP